MSNRLFIIIFIALVVGLTYNMWYVKNAGLNGTGPTVQLGGPFELIDQNGRKVRDTDFDDKIKIIYFGYTYCPDICPTGLATISEALNQLGSGATEVKPIFITLDPKRDSVEVMADYHQHFHKSFSYLTGTEKQINSVAKLYRIYHQKREAGDSLNYLIDHSTISYVMSKSGQYQAHFDQNASPEFIVNILKKMI